MKNRLLVAICITVVAVLSVAAAAAWHTESVQNQVVKAKAYADQRASEQLQRAAVELEERRVADECHDLQKNYDGQPVAVQKTSARPVCDLPELQ